MTNDEKTPVSEGIRLIHHMASALRGWLAVPPSIIQSTAPRISDRRLPQQLLVQSARKLCEDVGAAVSLLEQGFAGPPYVLVRACRENVVPMLYLAMAPAAEQVRFANFLAEQKPAAARLKLHHLAKLLLADEGSRLPEGARARLEGAILDEQQVGLDDRRAKQDAKAPADYSFNRLVSRVTEFMGRDHENEAGSFLTTVVDYWIESEVTHSGVDAIDAYHVKGGPWHLDQNRILDLLVLLMDLRVIATLSDTALLFGFTVHGKLPLPPAIQVLQQSTALVRDYLNRFPSSRFQSE